MRHKGNYLFITGMVRSGTTLLDKILDSHEQVSLFSQPFPFLFRLAKSKFFKQINYPETYYSLNNLFNERYYKPELFLEYLRKDKIEKSEIDTVLSEMKGWSGQLTKIKNSNKLTKGFKSSDFINTFKYLLNGLNLNKNIEVLGSKEVLTEEFIPIFLENDIKIIIIIRDPRDVYSSINNGKGSEYTGSKRPTLFHLRNWRKTIAIANTFKKHKNCLVLKYEDLIEDQSKTLNEICSFLNISVYPAEHFSNGIKNQEGEFWQGNSSTGILNGIDSSNRGKFKNHLSDNTIAYIEKVCRPEMLTYNYSFHINKNDIVLKDFVEPYKIDCTDLDPDMSTSYSELQLEDRRLELLVSSEATNDEIVEKFYSKKNFDILKLVSK